MRIPAAIAALFIVFSHGVLATDSDPQPIHLWPDSASANPEDNGSMTIYRPSHGNVSAAGVVVVPGGSFLIRCEDQEGRQVAKWLTARGITAFVVHYRLIPRFTMREELDDVRRAVQMARSRADEFGVRKLGMIGFSAGAYLAGEAALKPWSANAAATDPVAKSGSATDFMALVYGAPGGTNDPINGFNRFFAEQVGTNAWRALTATTPEQIAKAPPTFMFCTVEDRGAARRMGQFHLELLQHGVSSEAHFFAQGPHGVSFAQGDPVLGEWPNLFSNWMRAQGFLSPERSVPAKGVVQINGKPLELGYVVFKPKSGGQNLPVQTAYIFNRGGERGSFKLNGLIPGDYSATVYQMAARWNSVWAEPLLLQIQAKLNRGEKPSDNEVAEWKDWAAKRHYEPTQPDVVHFPPLNLRVTPETADNLQIQVSSAEGTK